MNNQNIQFNKYTVHLILAVFLISVTAVFADNIVYFRDTLVGTFSEPKKLTGVNININKLSEIAKDINIDINKINLISNKK